MAFARQCDRCKKLFVPRDYGIESQVYDHVCVSSITNHGVEVLVKIEQDLCDDCYKSLRRWMLSTG